MKIARNVIFVMTIALILGIASCTPAPTPVATQPPATTEPATEAPTVIPSPTIVPVSLAGPENGSTMVWVDGSTLIYIPTTEFKMGNGGFDAPEHNVTLDNYWIYQTKVTNRMYAQCVGVGSCTPPAQELGGDVYSNPDYANHPVVGVTWDQAQAYCSWTQGRLPTEAEWENAARGKESNLFPWGNDEPACDLLNFAYCVGHTTDVNAYADGTSSYGLLDMAGNVFEWIGDWYSENYYGEASLANPVGPDSGEFRVVRGSSFETDPDQAETAIRHFLAPSQHRRDTGFRCVVTEPKPFAPYCQLSAYVPTGAVASGECQLPFTEMRGQYCVAGTGFATVDIPNGAVYETTTKNFECSEAVIDGQRRLTCTGPRDSTGEITVCNPSCSTSPDVTGAKPVCDPGYTLDPGSGACNYTPIVGQVSVAGCPAGYVMLDRGGQKSCVIGKGANGQCPTGLYFDSLVGACMPPSGQSEIPYGIDNPSLASQTYQGCAAGYSYNDVFQCCQAETGGTYPGCAPGSTFNADLGACSPGEIKLSGPGCVDVSVDILKCSEPVDICSKIKSEATCIRFAYACTWDDKLNVCQLK